MVQDLKHSVRQLVRQPVFALTAVVTLAIGMGVNAVAFTLVNGMLFKGSAASAVDNVGRIATSPRDDPERYASLAEYERFDAALRGSAITAAEGRSTVAWQHDGVTSTAWVLFVSSEYFSQRWSVYARRTCKKRASREPGGRDISGRMSRSPPTPMSRNAGTTAPWRTSHQEAWC